MSLALLFGIFTSCGDDNDSPEEPNGIVGRWQTHQVIENDGTITPGDSNDIWVFGSNGNFQNIYDGEIATEGTYKVSGNTLTININDGEDSYSLSGNFDIKDNILTYRFSESNYPNEYETIKLKRM